MPYLDMLFGNKSYAPGIIIAIQYRLASRNEGAVSVSAGVMPDPGTPLLSLMA